MQEDFTLFQNILEESHPGLYWYTSKDSMNLYFKDGRSKLNDSLTENAFRNILSYVIAAIKCGHTTVRPSKKYSSYINNARAPVFPISIKMWPDTAVITSALHRRDSALRGSVITAINDRSIKSITDSLFQFVSAIL